ncbi:MAG: hypothetical protein CM15mP9_1490 [Methanobacteriota archaeon]|nr:MAG: hypothetical protein CM15mP9_1490 [Euryarchaeota archaeon]
MYACLEIVKRENEAVLNIVTITKGWEKMVGES